MVQSSPSYSDARVLCVGMDRAFDLMRKPPVPTGNSNKAGKPLVLRQAQTAWHSLSLSLNRARLRASLSLVKVFEDS